MADIVLILCSFVTVACVVAALVFVVWALHIATSGGLWTSKAVREHRKRLRRELGLKDEPYG